MADAETVTKPTEEEEPKETGDGDVEDEKEEKIYQEILPNRVIVARNHPLSYYVDRARRILRMEEELFVSGRGNTISMACTLVEVLKREKIADVETISTAMNVEPFFNRSGDARWTQPTAMIKFSLKRGEFGEYVADYRQRKVIEIFEKTDDQQNGSLTFEQLEKLEFAKKFRANEEQIEQSKKFLDNLKEKKLDLPTFIKYASILIHPLLKDKVFKAILSDEFDITAYEPKTAANST